MKTKKIEKTIFNLLMLLPFILGFCYYAFYFATLWRNSSATISVSLILTNFFSIFTRFGILNTYTLPVKYLMINIFGVTDYVANALSIYFIYMIIVELLHVLYNLIVWLPRTLRSLIERGARE